ncbi:hypothetical protein BDC45DRAFT_575063, partial [Circinella umbellata]
MSNALQTPSLANFKLPAIDNEPMKNYAPGSIERQKLKEAIDSMRAELPLEVPVVINGEKIFTGTTAKQFNPSDHAKVVCNYHEADASLIKK